MKRLALAVLVWLLAALPAHAAIGITWKASNFSTSNAASSITATPTWTPAANALLVCIVTTTYTSSPSDPTAVNGHGVSYTKLTLGTSTLSTTHKNSAWVALAGGSPTSAACVATLTTTNGTGATIIEYEVTGYDATGGTAASTIQRSSDTNNAASGTSHTLTLTAAAQATNRAIIWDVQTANAAQTQTGDYTITGTCTAGNGSCGNFNTPATGTAAAHRTASFSTSGAVTGSSTNWRMHAIEIKAAAVTGWGQLLGLRRNRLARPIE
jgi:hypothetical protein